MIRENQSMRLYLMRNIHRGIIMELLIKQLEELISPNEWCVTNLSNASALLMDAIDDLSWVGFYMMRAGELVLGPFQGKVACTHIKVGKGACGVCVQETRQFLLKM